MTPKLTVRSNRPHESGIALPMVLLFTLVSSVFAASVLYSLSVHGSIVQDDYNYTRALYVAESGLNRTTEAIWVAYLNQNPLPEVRMTWLDDHYEDYDVVDKPFGGMTGPQGDTYTVTAKRIMRTGLDDERYIVLESTGKALGTHMGDDEEMTERTITKVVRFGHDQSSIFDYVYFINNFGWFHGGTNGDIQSNGDVRANGNFSLNSTPLVNGDVYASENPDIGAAGDILGQGTYDTQTLTEYRNSAEDTWRPTWPEFEFGYDGNTEAYTQRDILEMPYLGDVTRFEALAAQRNSTLVTADVNISQSTDGPLVLIGTQANPIHIDGPVVVRGDVFITGYVEGQGTIYTDRNLHIVGDLKYVNPPEYDHAEGADPAASQAVNQNADFLGIAARGNVITGDYTASDWAWVKNYMKPSFTKPYTDEDGSQHSGDYTAYDGVKTDGSNRRDYESTWSNAEWAALVQIANQIAGRSGSGAHRPRQIDCLAYTNHLYGGTVEKCKFNGAIISRDEAIGFYNWIDMNFDYRAKAEGEFYIDIDLPKAANASPVIWLEGEYSDWVGKIDALDWDLQHSGS
ncbi:MAG: pilus assembly PilX N-terminal domain-containing protein [Candidatus Omnitrophica bacterium]|nr:pilus assembly PilX N-terminal domain-containing protein [Candidatus Omnitrophota bacterium]